MVEKLTSLGTYLTALLQKNKKDLSDMYTERELKGIIGFCEAVGVDAEKHNIFLKKIEFVTSEELKASGENNSVKEVKQDTKMSELLIKN